MAAAVNIITKIGFYLQFRRRDFFVGWQWSYNDIEEQEQQYSSMHNNCNNKGYALIISFTLFCNGSHYCLLAGCVAKIIFIFRSLPICNTSTRSCTVKALSNLKMAVASVRPAILGRNASSNCSAVSTCGLV